MNNLIFPEANAKPAEIAAALAQAMQQHPNYHDGAVAAVRTFHTLDLYTLQFLRKKFQEPAMRHQYPKGRDFEQGENYAFARIDEVLASAIEQAGGKAVRPEPEPEIPWNDLPEWVEWVAMDADKDWFQYENKPILQGDCEWWFDSKNTLKTGQRPVKTKKIAFTAPDWRTSLQQRPKTNAQC